MPLTISRREMVSTVASSDTSGMKGSKISHSASVRSEGYAFRSLISSSPFLGFLHMLLLSFIGLGTWFLHFLRELDEQVPIDIFLQAMHDADSSVQHLAAAALLRRLLK